MNKIYEENFTPLEVQSREEIRRIFRIIFIFLSILLFMLSLIYDWIVYNFPYPWSKNPSNETIWEISEILFFIICFSVVSSIISAYFLLKKTPKRQISTKLVFSLLMSILSSVSAIIASFFVNNAYEKADNIVMQALREYVINYYIAIPSWHLGPGFFVAVLGFILELIVFIITFVEKYGDL